MALSINPVVLNSNGMVNTTVAQHVQAGSVNKVAQVGFAAQLQAGLSNSADAAETIERNAESIEKLSEIELAPDVTEDESRNGGNHQSSQRRRHEEEEEEIIKADPFVGTTLNIKV